MARVFEFPNPVDEVSARLVAAGVVALVVLTLGTGEWWLLVPLVSGFVARVAAGPRFSPLGLLVTRVVRPRLSASPRLVPGPPKRFAQAMGVAFSAAAGALALAGATDAATVALVLLLIAAGLEAFLGICLGCRIFAMLMRFGAIPESVCLECADISRSVSSSMRA